jgi:hypothetical protein
VGSPKREYPIEATVPAVFQHYGLPPGLRIWYTAGMNKPLLIVVFLFVAVVAPLRGETMLSITSDRKINFFDSAAPAVYFKTVDIQGLGGADIMLSAACSPTGQLFVLTQAGTHMGVRLVDPQTGTTITPGGASVDAGGATIFGMDVDPASILRVDVWITWTRSGRFRLTELSRQSP